MSYAVQTDYRSDMPRTAKNGLPWKLIACHDTEGGTGLLGAQGTINFLVNNAGTRNASYHELWWYAEASDGFGVIRIVPTTHCSHSLNPNPPPNGPYEPDAWVRAGLGDGWRDPNQGVYAVSIAGRVSDVDRYSLNPKFVGHALRRIGEIRAEIAGIEGLAEHFRFNPSTRTDWGRLLTAKLGGLDFTASLPDTALSGGDPMLLARYQAWKAGPSGTVIHDAVNGSPLFTVKAGTLLSTSGETPDGQWRQVAVSRTPGDRAHAFAKRAELIPLVTPYDIPFDDAMWSLLLSRKAPVPASVPDCSDEVLAATGPLNSRLAGIKSKVAALAIDVAND